MYDRGALRVRRRASSEGELGDMHATRDGTRGVASQATGMQRARLALTGATMSMLAMAALSSDWSLVADSTEISRTSHARMS